MHRSGFTLIELLIVVAIIGILAAIAVPNFMEAQVRAKVARVESELRTIGMALEIYHLDWGVYPADRFPYEPTIACYPLLDPGLLWDLEFLLDCLTTPVAYMTSLPAIDPFNLDPLYAHAGTGKYYYVNDAEQEYWRDDCGRGDAPRYIKLYKTFLFGERWYYWLLKSAGPDQSVEWYDWPYNEMLYDSSNGTISHGDIERVGP